MFLMVYQLISGFQQRDEPLAAGCIVASHHAVAYLHVDYAVPPKTRNIESSKNGSAFSINICLGKSFVRVNGAAKAQLASLCREELTDQVPTLVLTLVQLDKQFQVTLLGLDDNATEHVPAEAAWTSLPAESLKWRTTFLLQFWWVA
ncbi:uncharacterized protein [Miscanthus floridulus]|uniref:uncharacterized protein isoform X1 n=1 Tax=Miscanthus floridulus TaxID=154761 RepID=UPI0034580B31